MKKNEVRHGNLVIYGGHQTTIDEKEIIHFIRFPDKYEPIPLTEEWLLKFGFKKDGGYYSKGRKHYHFLSNKFYLGNDHVSSGNADARVMHIHQLQNLYFALTGEELTI